ncbi:MAG: hypothetical protein LBD54_02870 [Puniceicoccales bacterium]|jgi:hypothetical protein|nr:hypothetical protein [Puniceicoccales bacterium]
MVIRSSTNVNADPELLDIDLEPLKAALELLNADPEFLNVDSEHLNVDLEFLNADPWAFFEKTIPRANDYRRPALLVKEKDLYKPHKPIQASSLFTNRRCQTSSLAVIPYGAHGTAL